MKFFDNGSDIVISLASFEEAVSKQKFNAEVSGSNIKIYGQAGGVQIYAFTDVEEPLESNINDLVSILNIWRDTNDRTKLTAVQRLSLIGPVEGLRVYDTDLSVPMFYDGVRWQPEVDLRVTTAQAIVLLASAVTGDKIFDIDLNIPMFFDGVIWQPIGILHFGEIYFSNTSFDTVLPAQDTPVQITGFDANGSNYKSIPDHGSDHITIVNSGKYYVSCHVSARSNTSNIYEYIIFKNNGAEECINIHAIRTTSTANRLGSASAGGFCQLNKNDTIEVWVNRSDGGAVSKTITTEHINLLVDQKTV